MILIELLYRFPRTAPLRAFREGHLIWIPKEAGSWAPNATPLIALHGPGSHDVGSPGRTPRTVQTLTLRLQSTQL